MSDREPAQRNLIVAARGRCSRGGVASESWRDTCDSEVMMAQDRVTYDLQWWRKQNLISDPVIAAAAATFARIKEEDSYD